MAPGDKLRASMAKGTVKRPGPRPRPKFVPDSGAPPPGSEEETGEMMDRLQPPPEGYDSTGKKKKDLNR